MDDWQKDWWQQLENTTATVEQFFNDINQAIESFSIEVTDVVEDLGKQLQNTVATELDRFVEDFEDFIEFVTESDFESEFDIWEDLENWAEDSEFVDITTEIPTKDRYAACINCSNYHGKAYNGQILVCAMHPHGVEDDSCPDWEESPTDYQSFF